MITLAGIGTASLFLWALMWKTWLLLGALIVAAIGMVWARELWKAELRSFRRWIERNYLAPQIIGECTMCFVPVANERTLCTYCRDAVCDVRWIESERRGHEERP